MDTNADKPTFATIDEYISLFPAEVQQTLQTLRGVILDAAPEAVEKISYQMPTFAQQGNLVHFAAYKNHIGFYPGASGVAAFKEELSGYKGAKGSVQFPIGQPLPYELISRIVKFRVADNAKRGENKGRKKK
ncbi:iron chaperone [Paenibacillus sp. NPDC058177]|uniref:iron chaperone n=1 Tax=Paenibacillus sp. NPDC058177 TaxID=3346369 RepID=UPI0036DCF60B